MSALNRSPLETPIDDIQIEDYEGNVHGDYNQRLTILSPPNSDKHVMRSKFTDHISYERHLGGAPSWPLSQLTLPIPARGIIVNYEKLLYGRVSQGLGTTEFTILKAV